MSLGGSGVTDERKKQKAGRTDLLVPMLPSNVFSRIASSESELANAEAKMNLLE